MEFTITGVIRETILPSPPATPHLVILSNNDQIMPPYYTGFLYFFPSSPSLQGNTEILKGSLARALAAFPPVAGRLKARSNGAMDVDCNNQGAVFLEAHATGQLQDFQTTGTRESVGGGMFQPSPLWKLLAPNPYEINQDSTKRPLLFIQLTRLACGGAALVVLLHHLVADGAAQAHFVWSWAELARGGEITEHPHLDRSLMKARTPPCPSFEHTEYIVLKELPTGYLGAEELPPMTSRIFEFLSEDILVLRNRANSEVGRDVFTGFQALAGHIWKHVTKARGIEPSKDIKLGWAVDGRKRFNPPLPQNYFGNVNFYGCAESNAGELMEKPLHDAATCIQSGIHRITDEYMHSALDFIEVQERPSVVNASFIRPSDLAITSWARFSSYDVDFGWGKPVFFASPIYDFRGLVILLPHPGGKDGANVLIGMFVDDMKALLSDADFYPVQ